MASYDLHQGRRKVHKFILVTLAAQPGPNGQLSCLHSYKIFWPMKPSYVYLKWNDVICGTFWCIKKCMKILKSLGLLYNYFEVNLRLSYVIDTSHPLIDLPNTKSYQERHLFFVRLVKLDLYYIYFFVRSIFRTFSTDLRLPFW